MFFDKRASGQKHFAAKRLEKVKALANTRRPALLYLVEVAGVEPASEDTAARRLQA